MTPDEIAREPGQTAYEAAVKNVEYATPFAQVHGMERTVWEDIERACFRAAEARGYAKAREQAAGRLEHLDDVAKSGVVSVNLAVAAIRKMEPEG